MSRPMMFMYAMAMLHMACSGRDDDTGEAVAGATARFMEDSLVCARWVSCPMASVEEATHRGWAIEAEVCRAEVTRGSTRIWPATVVVDDERYAACRRQIQQTCLDPEVLPACAGWVVGVGREACTQDLDCAAGDHCRRTEGDCGVCAPSLGEGAPCERDGQCASTSSGIGRCVFDRAAPTKGVCRTYTLAAPAPEGATCGRVDEDQVFIPCAASTYCRATTSTNGNKWVCARPRPEGAACEAWVDACASGSVCRQGVCQGVPRTEVGATCSDAGGGCNPHRRLACVEGECVELDGEAGSRCDTLPCLPGHACGWHASEPVCAPLRADGEACGDALECESDHCAADGRCAPAEPSRCAAPD